MVLVSCNPILEQQVELNRKTTEAFPDQWKKLFSGLLGLCEIALISLPTLGLQGGDLELVGAHITKCVSPGLLKIQAPSLDAQLTESIGCRVPGNSFKTNVSDDTHEFKLSHPLP